MFALSNNILGIILLTLLFFIVVKKIILEVRGIDRGGIFLVAIGLGLIGMICSIFALLGASNINQLINQIPIDLSHNIVVIGIEKYIARQEFFNIIYLVIGYTTLISECIIYKIICKKHKQELEQARTNNNWNLNKLN